MINTIISYLCVPLNDYDTNNQRERERDINHVESRAEEKRNAIKNL